MVRKMGGGLFGILWLTLGCDSAEGLEMAETGGSGSAGMGGRINSAGAGAGGRIGGVAGMSGFAGAGVGGAGGSVGGAGAGAGNLGGSAGLPVRMPDCLVELYALCPASGACLQERGTESTTYCYESGTKGEVFWPVCDGTFTDTYYKADGSVCFTLTTSLPLTLGCENYARTWKDADGVTVATGSYYSVSLGEGRVQCSDGGDSTICPGSNRMCGWTSDPDACIAGTCP